jgi:hypothetical protein
MLTEPNLRLAADRCPERVSAVLTGRHCGFLRTCAMLLIERYRPPRLIASPNHSVRPHGNAGEFSRLFVISKRRCAWVRSDFMVHLI